MLPLRIPPHTINNLRKREIPLDMVREAVGDPEQIASGNDFRKIYMRRYWDDVLDEQMLIRVVVEETDQELVIVTAYKTSKIGKYLRGVE